MQDALGLALASISHDGAYSLRWQVLRRMLISPNLTLQKPTPNAR
jgi:hypothetical protein